MCWEISKCTLKVTLFHFHWCDYFGLSQLTQTDLAINFKARWWNRLGASWEITTVHKRRWCQKAADKGHLRSFIKVTRGKGQNRVIVSFLLHIFNKKYIYIYSHSMCVKGFPKAPLIWTLNIHWASWLKVSDTLNISARLGPGALDGRNQLSFQSGWGSSWSRNPPPSSSRTSRHRRRRTAREGKEEKWVERWS